MMRMIHLSAAALLVLVSACTQPALPEDHYYRLGGAAPKAGAGGALSGIVEVNRFIASGLTASRAIVYTDSTTAREVRAYHYHLWAEPPPIMLQNALVSYLRAANAAPTVVTPDMRVEPDFIVSGKIRRFEQVRGAAGKVNVELELSVKRSRDDKLILLKPYAVSVGTKGATVGEAVTRISQGINAIYAKFLSDIPR